MAMLGTRTFCLPPRDGAEPGGSRQILMHAGYVTITLDALQYQPEDDRWLKIFGGDHRIAVTCRVSHRYAGETVEATTVQHIGNLKARHDHSRSIGEIVALKVPTDADAIEFGISISVVREDKLDRALELLSSADFKKPLELAPAILGPVVTITALVKRLLTQNGSVPVLDANYPGILTQEPTPDPASLSCLVAGRVAMLARHGDDDDLHGISPAELEYADGTLWHRGEPLACTYAVFSVSATPVRGLNTRAPWYRKYQGARQVLDRLGVEEDAGSMGRIYDQAVQHWVEGSALLDADATYLEAERLEVKMTALAGLKSRYREWAKRQVDGATAIDAIELAGPGDDALPPRSIAELPYAKLSAAADAYRERLRAAGLEWTP